MDNRIKLVLIIAVVSIVLIVFVKVFIKISSNKSSNEVVTPEIVKNQIEEFLSDTNSKSLTIDVEGRCYWLRNTANATSYILQIVEFNTTKDCTTEQIDTRDIVVQNSYGIIGDTDCLCPGKYDLEKNVAVEYNELMITKVK